MTALARELPRLPPDLQPGAPIGDRLSPVSLAVVGVRHANKDKSKSNRRFELRLCMPGDPVELRPEPRNPVDPQAVAVFSSRGVQIGYVTAERAPRIGALIREGREVQAVFQDETEFGAWIRVAFDGEAPKLPPQSAAPIAPARKRRDQEPEQDFYPDEEWPD